MLQINLQTQHVVLPASALACLSLFWTVEAASRLVAAGAPAVAKVTLGHRIHRILCRSGILGMAQPAVCFKLFQPGSQASKAASRLQLLNCRLHACQLSLSCR